VKAVVQDLEFLAIKLKGKMKDPQWIQVLVPLRDLSFYPNVCGLRRCFRDGYSDEELPLEEKGFIDTWDIFSSKH
jgi:hypothetical protein